MLGVLLGWCCAGNCRKRKKKFNLTLLKYSITYVSVDEDIYSISLKSLHDPNILQQKQKTGHISGYKFKHIFFSITLPLYILHKPSMCTFVSLCQPLAFSLHWTTSILIYICHPPCLFSRNRSAPASSLIS